MLTGDGSGRDQCSSPPVSGSGGGGGGGSGSGSGSATPTRPTDDDVVAMDTGGGGGIPLNLEAKVAIQQYRKMMNESLLEISTVLRLFQVNSLGDSVFHR